MQDKFPNNLSLLRAWRDMSQLELADLCRCSPTSISEYERGTREIPSHMRQSFAKAFKVPENMIVGPVTIIPQLWDRLVTDPRLPIVVEEILSYDSKRLSRLVHSIAERNVHSYAL